MNIKHLEIIPDYGDIDKSIQLACQYGTGFEYNDFFVPAFLDNKKAVDDRIAFYKDIPDSIRANSTLHGVFLDITVFSDDPLIVKASDTRIHQSMDIARRLGVRGVVFHTNYIANFIADFYRNNWVKRNNEYFTKLCREYSDINIYIENMFDTNPELVISLAESMKDISNFGVCFDFSHAQVFGDENMLDTWVKGLAPYVKHIHINDHDFISDLHLVPGQGKTDWNKFRQYYEKYFADASVLLEVTGNDKAEKSLEFISKL